MSASFNSESEYSYDIGDLLQIKSRCIELRKEKDMLRKSQSQSFEMIRSLELHVKTLSEARSDDKKHIQELERELRNCSQEIDYLQDQLNTRDAEVNYLGEQVHSLELKLADTEDLQEEVVYLRGELKRSISECLFLMRELESKEVELQNSTACIVKLEESISSAALESQCEIESMKLDLIALEQSCLEAKKIKKELVQGTARMGQEFEDPQKAIECLYKENKELKEKLETREKNIEVFCQIIEGHLNKWLDGKDNSSQSNAESFSELISREKSTCGEVLGPLLSKLAVVVVPYAELKENIHEYEVVVKQLKEELREEKLKGKEEAEDLAQEMAELRYQITGMLEHECKRRACIEQASLQRIAELEAQIQNGDGKSFAVVRHYDQV